MIREWIALFRRLVAGAVIASVFGSDSLVAAQTTLDHVGSERRIALVVGNGNYKFSPLKNPTNDARAMGQALKDLGFTVIQLENVGMQAMLDATRDFANKAKDYQVRVFYYAGHGVQVKGKNYLIPVDADVTSEDEIQTKAADVNELIEKLGQITTGLNILILDACRNNPFVNTTTVGPDGRRVKFRGTGQPGLAQVAAPQGMLVAFSTAPGAIAMDGGNMQNGLYTKHLLANIGVAGLPVEQMLKRVRIAVVQETQRLQVPWESSSIMGDFCFRAAPGGKCIPGDAMLIDPARLAPK